MIIASAANFMSTYRGVKHSVLNVKVLVGTFNKEKALVGAFSLIVKPMDRLQHYSGQGSARPAPQLFASYCRAAAQSCRGSRSQWRPVSIRCENIYLLNNHN